MTVRVNLLPREVEERNRAVRQRALATGAGALLVLGLAGGYLYQVRQVGAAEDQLAAEQDRLQALEAEVATLREYEDLESRVTASESLLATALGGEASFAGLMQDVAAVVPSDVALTQVTVTLGGDDDARPGDAEAVTTAGTLTVEGNTTSGHAPGMHRFLLQLEKVAAFDDVYFSRSELTDDGLTEFSIDVELGPEILTGRYLAGLPEELR